MNLKQRIQKGLNSLTSSSQRAKVVSLFVTACSLLYHSAICIFFKVIGIPQMFYYNFVSISVFLFILIAIPRVKSFVFVYYLALAEVIVHQVLADYFLGSYTSFHSLIIFRKESKKNM